jgi:sulfur-oxidizing protein SoxB
MTIRRRDFLSMTGGAALSAGLLRRSRAADSASTYDLERFGNARILHLNVTHAQLKPVNFCETNINMGLGAMAGQPPHLVGRLFSTLWHRRGQRRRLCLHQH